MDDIRADRLRLLMKEKRLSSAELLARLHQTAGNERVHRGTVSGVLNNRYRGTPSVVFVRGLAQVLETTTDYLLGLSDEPQSGAMAFASRYTLADEEQLLILLAEQNKELADIMRAIRDIPDEEQIVILQHLEDEVAFVRRMVAERAAAQASSGADRPDPPANNPLYLSWDTDDDH